MTKNDDTIPDPMSDVFTASLWSAPKNEHLLVSFINSVRLDSGQLPIVQAKVLNPFNIKEFDASKGIILDVRAKDESNRLYDVEVQTSSHPAFPNRMLDYWAESFSSQLKSGMEYAELRQVLSIILSDFRIFPQLENIHNIFEIRAREKPSFVMSDAFQMHVLRVFEVREGDPAKQSLLCRDLRDWLLFFAHGGKLSEAEMSNITDNNPVIQEVYCEMQRFYSNPEAREKARQRRRFLVDFNLGMTASEAKGQARTILFYLQRRFGIVPLDLENRLLSMSDIGYLDRLRDLSFDCNSLDEFESGLV